MKGKLYVVPTPIGNLEDITLRAIRILSEVDLILAEDTRVSRKLLSHYKIDKAIESHHQNNEHATVFRQIDKMNQGQSIALISDAGTPSISDPGFLLVRETVKAGITVDCLPGPTALIVALVNSGIPTERFVFEGFLENHACRKRKSIPFKYFISNSETCHMRRSSSQNPLDTSNCKGRKLSNTIRIYVNLNQHCVL